MSAGASWPKTESVGKKKKTAECRLFIIVSLPAKFEEIEIKLRPQQAAHCRKTVRCDESDRPKKKRKKIPLSQIRLPSGSVGESKADIKKKVKPNLICLKLIIAKKSKDVYVYKSGKIGYDEEEN